MALDPAAAVAEASRPASPTARAAVERLRAPLERAMARLAPSPPVPLHNDLHAGDLLLGAEGLRIIDWNMLTVGSRLQELDHVCSLLDVPAAGRARVAAAYAAAEPALTLDEAGLADARHEGPLGAASLRGRPARDAGPPHATRGLSCRIV